MFLLDTNVISELGRPSGKGNSKVIVWSESVRQAELYLSVITILEIEMGILQTVHRNDQASLSLRPQGCAHGWIAIFDLRLLIGFCR
jgi:predicted nucleic acid-binding protein